LSAASISLMQLVRTVRSMAKECEHRGGNWRDALTRVREQAPSIWQRLAPRERRRFLRHLRCYWDVHRHRLPERPWTALADMRRAGSLHVHAGRLLQLEPAGKRIRVLWRARGEQETRQLTVDRVINCTGPDHDIQRSRQPLVRSLMSQGMAV